MPSDANFHRRFLEKVGLKSGHTVLDFDCGTGEFSVAAAQTVGPKGKVVCMDRQPDNLAYVVQKAEELGLDNLKTMVLAGGLPSTLESGSFDFILLFDTLHAYRFPSMEERSALFRELRRLLKDDGTLSYSPTSSAGYWGLTPSKLLAEAEACGLVQVGIVSDDLSHHGVLQRITAYSYRKG